MKTPRCSNHDDNDEQNSPQQREFDVVIVGAGVAGCSAAHHLQPFTSNLLLVDAGPAAGEGVAPRHAGSATMSDDVAPCVKMMVQLFAGSCAEFAKHHGDDGIRRYLKATQQGLQLQKQIAKDIWQNDWQRHLKLLGSYYVTTKEEEMVALKQEYHRLSSFSDCLPLQWVQESFHEIPGMPTNVKGAIYFPNDAIIDSSLYAKTLLQSTLEKYRGKAEFLPGTRVVKVEENPHQTYATITMGSGQKVKAKHVVMATGALDDHDSILQKLLKPCYSYLVHVPVATSISCQDSANFFTWGYTHDWCFTNGKVRCSGEDHFSAYKDPHTRQRCRNLSKWTLEQYECLTSQEQDQQHDNFWDDIPQQYGLYSETPDLVPLIGHTIKRSRICYLAGCNAWGQTILSYSASLVPGMLGYRELTKDQKDILELMSIRRFAYLDLSPATLH